MAESWGLFRQESSRQNLRCMARAVLGQKVYVPSTGVTSVGLLQVERGVKGVRYGLDKGVAGAKSLGKGTKKLINKIF